MKHKKRREEAALNSGHGFVRSLCHYLHTTLPK